MSLQMAMRMPLILMQRADEQLTIRHHAESTMSLRASLFTFGYEGLSIEAFISRLKDARVDLIVDVRELPLSRKKGFSKSAFREALAASGIGYEHRPALGCPKPVRDQYKVDGDWSRYTQGFMAYLDKQGAEIDDLAKTARGQRACLVCFEADFNFCHRTYVARAVHTAGGPVVQHLSAKTVTADSPALLAA
jgi:hypothetical protein